MAEKKTTEKGYLDRAMDWVGERLSSTPPKQVEKVLDKAAGGSGGKGYRYEGASDELKRYVEKAKAKTSQRKSSGK